MPPDDTPIRPGGGDSETRLAATPLPGAAASPLTVGQNFGERYHIIKLLGAGGMGAVYQAWDAELGVAVALKVIRPDATGDAQHAQEAERRFKQELLLARKVTHKNVVRIHDLGEMNGIKYITMPYIQGADLDTIMRREGTVAVPRAVAIAKQVVEGLQAAHEAGVVHRDLKPANIMVDANEHACIMDFGISRSAASDTATMTRGVIGTVAYMAPEQASGHRADQRTDIYSFGLILYDILTGDRRLQGREGVTELVERMQHAPPVVRTLDSAIPEPLSGIIDRCLQPDPAARYQTSAELAADLARLDPSGHVAVSAVSAGPARAAAGPWSRPRLIGAVAALALAVAAAGAVWWAAGRQTPSTADAPRTTVSVLISDFENRTGDAVFDGSLEQPLAVALEGASFITTFPRRDAMAVGGQIRPGAKLDETLARLISRREGITVVLAGGIESSGGGYRVAVKAIDPGPGKVFATESEDASSKTNVFEAVATVAAKLRRALGDTALEGDKLAAAETFTAASLEAARDFARGQQLMSDGKYDEAVEYYRRATTADPAFGRAYAAWAVSEYSLGRPNEAKKLYERAFAHLDRMTEREKYRTLGSYYLQSAANYEKATENYAMLVKLYPSDRAGHSMLGLSNFYVRNFGQAREHGRRAVEIYRGSPKFRSNSALYAMYAGDFQTAADEAAALVKENPQYYRAYLPIAMAALARSDPGAALEAYRGMHKGGAQGESLASIGLADLAMYQGRFREAEALLRAGIDKDIQITNPAGAASKYVALAEALHAQGRDGEAAAAAGTATKLGGADEAILVGAARALVQAGHAAQAEAIARDLGGRLQPESRAYARVIEGEAALSRRRTRDAIDAFRAAQKLVDMWLARFDLGLAYVEAGYNAEGLSELELCLKRKGEVTAMFLNDVPSFRYAGPISYWLGRAQDGLGMTSAARGNYRAYLAIRPEPALDPLARHAQRRSAQ